MQSPEDIEAHTPCSIVHNFLAADEADGMLKELIQEVSTFRRDKFQMSVTEASRKPQVSLLIKHRFDRAVESPHTSRLYVDSWDELEDQKTGYMYNGGYLNDIGKTPTEMLNVSARVRRTVNEEIQRRTNKFQPGGRKLKFQSPEEWRPNASFVNCYG